MDVKKDTKENHFTALQSADRLLALAIFSTVVTRPSYRYITNRPTQAQDQSALQSQNSYAVVIKKSPIC